MEALELESRDCACLVPDAGGPAAALAAALSTRIAAVEADTAEMETKNEQYRLLAARTTRDRDEAERAMRAAREVRNAAGEDVHTLTQHMHETRAAKEAAERRLGTAVAMFDQVGLC